MAWYQLMQGIHVDAKNGITYKVVTERNDETGEVSVLEQPIFECTSDLVAQFGKAKFRKVPDAEAKSLGLVGSSEKTKTVSDEPSQSAVHEAAKEGAKEVVEQPGKDVTEKFDQAKSAGLTIYRKDRNQYVVKSKDGELLTEEPITRKNVEQMIKEYL